MLTQYLLK